MANLEELLRIGFKFKPRDEQLITLYLLNKLTKKPLPMAGLILEGNVYDQQVLSNIFLSSEPTEETRVYFFTHLKKKATRNVDRTVGNGTWKSEHTKDIKDNKGNLIGKKHSLDYICPGSAQNKKWNMKEFSLAGDSLKLPLPEYAQDYAITMVQKKARAIEDEKKAPKREMEQKVKMNKSMEKGNEDTMNVEELLRIGFKFEPKDEQLITYYLLNKINKKPLPMEGLILEADLYNEQVLSNIFQSLETIEETKVYFFTHLRKKSPKIVHRTVGNGRWRSEYASNIQDNKGNIIGKKHILDYSCPLSAQHKRWNMKEFSLGDDSLKHPLPKKDRGDKRKTEENVQSMNKRTKIESNEVTTTLAVASSGSPANALPITAIKSASTVEHLEQIRQDPAPNASRANVENVVAANTLATLPSCAIYNVLECILPLTSMPLLVEVEQAATLEEEDCYALREKEIGMLQDQPSIAAADQSLQPAPETSTLPLASAPPVTTAAENGVETLEQPESLLFDSSGHAEAEYEMVDNKIWVESFAQDLLRNQPLPFEEDEPLIFPNTCYPTYDTLFG